MWTKKMPIETNEIKKILIIQFTPYSNVFLASITFETLKKSFPNSELYFLLKDPYQEIVTDHKYLDQTILFPKEKGFKYFTSRAKLFMQIRKEKFDLIIDYQADFVSKQVCFFSGAKYRIGYGINRPVYTYNYKVPVEKNKYIVLQKFDLLRPLGIESEPNSFHFCISDESTEFIDKWLKENDIKENNFILMTPGSAKAIKKWRNSYFASLGDLIIDTLNLPVVLLGSNDEQADCQRVYELMISKPIIAPEMSLNRAVALIKRSKVLICNDGCLNHVSCATDTKTIAIFGNTDPAEWSPVNLFEHHHHLYKENYPSKHDDSFGISPQSVLNKIIEIIK